MARIERLADEVINQIAAGEVVERPASAAKELIENALDAGAHRIQITIEDGGQTLIRIVDDGSGMSARDARLCLERHATSKLRSVQDLNSIRSLGFRGEAVSSIASVSRFTLTTRVRDDEVGTRIEAEGGQRQTNEAIGAPAGTEIEVRDLFFNVPARQKFLKRASTETSHIVDVVTRLALAHPECAFVLTSNGREVLDAPQEAPSDRSGRLARILGDRVAHHLFSLTPEGEGPVRVSGYLSEPGYSERTTRALYVFINRRFVRDRTIQHAIQDAYRGLLERGRHPVVVLFIELEPDRFDVNVHPQKTEVRFLRSGEVHRAVGHALRTTLQAEPWARPLTEDRSGAVGATVRAGPRRRTYVLKGDAGSISGPASSDYSEKRLGRYVSASLDFAREPAHGEPSKKTANFSGLRAIGQILGTYVVCEASDGMVVIDQHAAHERITYARLREAHQAQRTEAQPLLIPVQVELDTARADVASRQKAELARMGLELEPFGGKTWLIKSCPALLQGASPKPLVLDVLDEFAALDASAAVAERHDLVLSRMACHASVRAGDRLEREEIQALLDAMDTVDFGAHCPHGRPVFVKWSRHELEKLFHRG